MIIKKVNFEVILPTWKKKLWVGRESKIQSMSSIQFLGGYDMTIYEKYTPTFWAVFDDKNIVAVNSGFSTSSTAYRSRGIWVDKTHRKLGVAQLLFDHIDKQAKEENKMVCWSIPRKEALPAYEKAGYIKCSDWFDEGMEFGPNCYVKKIL